MEILFVPKYLHSVLFAINYQLCCPVSDFASLYFELLNEEISTTR